MKLAYDPRPGMLVRCIAEPTPRARHPEDRFPKVGIIYTIRDTFDFNGHVGLHLIEIPNPYRLYSLDGQFFRGAMGFQAVQFVPVDPHALDVFRQAKQPREVEPA